MSLIKPFGFFEEEGWRKMHCGRKAEEICFYSFYYYNIILTTKLFHAEPSRLGCNFGDALCFPLWMFCCFVNSAQLSRVTPMCSAWRETNPHDFLIFEVFYGAAAFCGAPEGQGLDLPGETTILYQSTTCPGQTFTWSTGSLVSGNRFSVPKSKELLSSGRTIQKNTDLISSKHFQNPSYTQPSLRIYDIPFRVKALCLPSFNKMPVYSSRGSHVSNHREAGSEEKSTWEKTHLCPHPFCWSGHEQTACFHCRGNPFHFQLSGCWNLHTLPESGMVTANKTPSPMNWEE